MLVQPLMAVIDHATIQRYKVWEGGDSHPRGEGFIVVSPSPSQAMDDEPTDMPEQPSSSSSEYFVPLQDLHRKVDRQN